jgi:AraC family transcriptional regulator
MGIVISEVQLKTLPRTPLAYLRHTGPYGQEGLRDTWRRFGGWLEGIGAERSPVWGLAWDDPRTTDPALCRYDCCLPVNTHFGPQGEIGIQAFAGGAYACARFRGHSAEIPGAWASLLGRWLPRSGYSRGEGPSLEVIDKGFAAISNPAGPFECWLCVPVLSIAA